MNAVSARRVIPAPRGLKYPRKLLAASDEFDEMAAFLGQALCQMIGDRSAHNGLLIKVNEVRAPAPTAPRGTRGAQDE